MIDGAIQVRSKLDPTCFLDFVRLHSIHHPLKSVFLIAMCQTKILCGKLRQLKNYNSVKPSKQNISLLNLYYGYGLLIKFQNASQW